MQTSLQNMTHLHHTKSHRTQPKHTPKISMCTASDMQYIDRRNSWFRGEWQWHITYI